MSPKLIKKYALFMLGMRHKVAITVKIGDRKPFGQEFSIVNKI
jgi:hypothetical protein